MDTIYCEIAFGRTFGIVRYGEVINGELFRIFDSLPELLHHVMMLNLSVYRIVYLPIVL